MIRFSVLITTYNEERNLPRCLDALKDHQDIFDEIVVIDSNSSDLTKDVAESYGVSVHNFQWNGQYPKKRQWILENVSIKNNWVFFLDADEVVTPSFINNLKYLNTGIVGYFVRSQCVLEGNVLKYGLYNNKLAIFDRRKIEFPVVDDLSVPEMGEMEGHYQPVFKGSGVHRTVGQIKLPILHYAYEDSSEWTKRHDRYARWEAYMIAHRLYPKDPSWLRQTLKAIFRGMPLRSWVMFVHCYVFKLGFLDGSRGFEFARSRYQYYECVSAFLKNNTKAGVRPSS